MARKAILDLLPRNLESHNLSHVTLTPAQSRTLGLGLKFRLTLSPPAARVFDSQIQDFVVVSVCITNLLISPMILTSTPN